MTEEEIAAAFPPNPSTMEGIRQALAAPVDTDAAGAEIQKGARLTSISSTVDWESKAKAPIRNSITACAG